MEAIAAAAALAGHRRTRNLRLIGHVAGFVFCGGSALCHLAVLLREARVPAVVATVEPPTAGDYIATIDNGQVHLAGAHPN